MHRIVAETLQSRKVKNLVILASVLMAGFGSFGLGRLSAYNAVHEPISLCASVAADRSAHAPAETEPETKISAAAPPVAGTQAYVASRNGSVYHLPWCAGAKRIKEENKVWFASKEDAEAAGYRKASNCDGL